MGRRLPRPSPSVRRVLGRFLLLGGAVALGGLAVDALPRALAGLELFRVQGVRFEGARYLDPAVGRTLLALPAGASVWDEPDPWLQRLRTHPLVDGARVRRRLPDSLVVEVTEREPVALVATPTLEPVDEEGLPLPVDPTVHRLDLPVLTGAAGGEDGPAARRRALAPLAREVARLARAEPRFVEMVSEVTWAGGGGAVAYWGDPAVEIRFHPPLTAERVHQARQVLADAAVRFPERRPRGVDLRYLDQVVVRF